MRAVPRQDEPFDLECKVTLPFELEWDCPRCGECLGFDDDYSHPRLNGSNDVYCVCDECGLTSEVSFVLKLTPSDMKVKQ